MKKLLLYIVLLISVSSRAQTVTSIYNRGTAIEFRTASTKTSIAKDLIKFYKIDTIVYMYDASNSDATVSNKLRTVYPLDYELITTPSTTSSDSLLTILNSYFTSSGGGGVTGTGTINYVTKWNSTTSIANSQIFDNATNVGIDDATPSAKLDIHKASGEVLRLATDGFGDPKVSFYDDVFELGYITTKRTDGNKMFFGSNSVEALRISGANVGVGYTDGNTRLYVNNGGGLTYSFIVDGGGANAIAVTGSGDKVGIGTTSPDVKFDVNGVGQIRRFQDATGGGTLQPSNQLRLQTAYWNGSASVSRYAYWRLNQLSIAPLEETALYNQADTKLFSVTGNGLPFFSGIPAYADNTAALAGGLVAGNLYYTDVAGEYILKVAH